MLSLFLLCGLCRIKSHLNRKFTVSREFRFRYNYLELEDFVSIAHSIISNNWFPEIIENN